ncbi:MAG TPA: hypothetical protein VF653_21505 [Methylomirabilota bacterium]
MIGYLHAFFAAAPAGRNAPVLAYTVPNTLANVLPTLAGPIVVLLT